MTSNKKKHPIRNVILSVIIIIFISVSIVCGLLLKQGYDLYKEKTLSYPIDTAFASIMDSEDFVEFDQLPRNYINAVISVEDHRFFYRNGIDVIAVTKALFENIIKGEVVRGGSTITQQVAKNIYFDMSQVLSRKLAEIFFVNDMESNYSKEDIFSIYVSIIYFGDGYYGIKDAAQGYLGKSVEELDLCEAALLAGLPQAPSSYQLSNHSEYTYQRYLQVLAAMVEYGHITQQQYDSCRVVKPGGIK